MKFLVKMPDGREWVHDLGRIVRFGEPDWVDPASHDFPARSVEGVSYQLRPATRWQRIRARLWLWVTRVTLHAIHERQGE